MKTTKLSNNVKITYDDSDEKSKVFVTNLSTGTNEKLSRSHSIILKKLLANPNKITSINTLVNAVYECNSDYGYRKSLSRLVSGLRSELKKIDSNLDGIIPDDKEGLGYTILLPESDNKGTSGSDSFESPDDNSHIKSANYNDLIKFGLTPLEIAKQLVENDLKLYEGITDENEGTAEQWAKYLSSYPETFQYLFNYNTGEIIGNFSFLSINDQQEKQLLEGTLKEIHFTPRETRSLYSVAKNHILYLLNFSVNTNFSRIEYKTLLTRMFLDQLKSYANNGLYFKKIIVNIFRECDEAYFKAWGFEKCKDAKSEDNLYEINLFPYPQKMYAHFKENPKLDEVNKALNDMYSIACVQLTDKSELSENNINQIATLIYFTDKYIYPCIFNNVKKAQAILAQLLTHNFDMMFNLNNCFVAIMGDDIVGLLLWKKGPLHWNDMYLKASAKSQKIILPNDYDKAKYEYFSSYADSPEDQINIFNFSIDQSLRNCGVGSLLIKEFINSHQNEEMELFVLAENPSAIHLYQKYGGFNTEKIIDGFSPKEQKPACLMMRRNTKMQNKKNVGEQSTPASMIKQKTKKGGTDMEDIKMQIDEIKKFLALHENADNKTGFFTHEGRNFKVEIQLNPFAKVINVLVTNTDNLKSEGVSESYEDNTIGVERLRAIETILAHFVTLLE